MRGAFAATQLSAVQQLLSLPTRQLDVPTELFFLFSEAMRTGIILMGFNARSALTSLPPYHDETCSSGALPQPPLGLWILEDERDQVAITVQAGGSFLILYHSLFLSLSSCGRS